MYHSSIQVLIRFIWSGGQNRFTKFWLALLEQRNRNCYICTSEIVARYPDIVYIIVGATHPHVIQHEGETYRLSLQWLAQQKGVESNVIFYNRFVSLEELIEFISACRYLYNTISQRSTDSLRNFGIYIRSWKAVISTPYWYAQEILSEGRGVLVPFRDPAAVADR